MNMIRQLLGNHNHSHASNSASPSPAHHQPQQKRGKNRGGTYAWGGKGGQGGDDNSSITTGITEFSRSMSRDASLPLQHSDILEESCGDSDNNIIHDNSTGNIQNGTGNLRLRARSSSFDAKANFSHQPNNTSTRHPRSRSSSNNKSRRKKKNKDQEKVTLNHIKKKEIHFTQNNTPTNAVTPPPPPQCNDTIEFIDLKDPAPTTPTITTNKEEEEESVEDEGYVVALLEEYQHEIKRLERLNATLAANLETLTAAALLNGGEENNSSTTTTLSTTNVPVTMHQPCLKCSHCGSGGGGGGGSSSTSNPSPPPRRESLASSSSSDICHDMILTETHYLSKISKLQKSNHELNSELERKKKLISQLLLNLSMAADKIKELSTSIGSENNKNNKKEDAILLGKGQSTDDDDDDDTGGHIHGNCVVGRDGWRTNNDEASYSMQQIRQYQIQVIENELKSLLQIMSARSDSHAQRRHALIDEYRRHGDENDGHRHHNSLEKRRQDETPEEILQRVIRNLRGGDDEEKEGGGCRIDGMTTEQQQQQQVVVEVTHPPPPPVATSMAANETPSSSSLKNIGGDAGIWDSITSLFYGSGQTLSQALPQCHEEEQLQLKEVVPSLEIQKHPLCEEVESFDKNCLRKAPLNTNTIGWRQKEVDESSKSYSTYVKAVESFAKSTTTPDTTADSFVTHTSSNDDVSTTLPLMECQEEIDGVVNSVDVNTEIRVLDDDASEDMVYSCLKSNNNSLGSEAPLAVHMKSAEDSIGSFVAKVEQERTGVNFIADVPVLNKDYMIDEAQEVENGIVDVGTHENSINMKEGDGIVKTEGIESDPQSGLTNTQTTLEDCVEEDDGDGNIINVPDSYGIDLVNPSHDEDDSAELYTAKEPKDEGDCLEQADVRSGHIEGEYNDIILENEPINHDGYRGDNQMLHKDENGEINENGGLESSYIGIVSLSNANLIPARDQLKEDNPLNGSTFDQSLLQLSPTPAHGGNTYLESVALSPTLPASTPTSEMRTSKPSIDLAAVELVEKMVVGNKTLCETLGSIQGNRLARFDDSIDDRSMMYHHSITSLYRKPSHTNSYGDDSLSIRLGRKQLFQHQGSLDLSDIQPDVYGDWQILVKSKDNNKYFVPRYKTPVLPPQSVNKAVPLFKKGLKDGHYRYASSSGNEYSGHWVNGKRHGYGVAKYHDGEIYHGQWRRGRRHGHGVLHLSNREVFDGYWSSNKKHGLGMYFWTDGEVDISWYQDDVRLESLRWTSDRRRAYRLDLASAKKEQISLARAADKVRDWERKREIDVD